jgi:hypothetical protein
MNDVTAWRKSSRSGVDNNSDCVELRRTWRKSSRSGVDNNSSCVELAACPEGDGFHVCDSKLGDASPVFDLTPRDLTSLLGHARLERCLRRFDGGFRARLGNRSPVIDSC